MEEKQKCCFKCLKTKPLCAYYKHKHMGDGHLNKCIECAKQDEATRYNNNFLKIREYEQKRFKDPKRKAKVIEYQRIRRKKYPEKNKARNKVRRAIKSGKLIRLPCVKCGELKSQAHHHDYSKPLDVIWLCFKCHRLEHGQLNVFK